MIDNFASQRALRVVRFRLFSLCGWLCGAHGSWLCTVLRTQLCGQQCTVSCAATCSVQQSAQCSAIEWIALHWIQSSIVRAAVFTFQRRTSVLAAVAFAYLELPRAAGETCDVAPSLGKKRAERLEQARAHAARALRTRIGRSRQEGCGTNSFRRTPSQALVTVGAYLALNEE